MIWSIFTEVCCWVVQGSSTNCSQIRVPSLIFVREIHLALAVNSNPKLQIFSQAHHNLWVTGNDDCYPE